MMSEKDLVEQAFELYANGDVKEALASLDQAISKAVEGGNKLNQARAMGKKGVILLESDQLAAARVCLEEVLALSEELENQEIKADALSNLGLVITTSGDPGTGLLKQQEATIIARKTENQFLIMTHLGLLGHAYIQLANVEEAGKTYFEALKIAKEIEDISSQSGFLNNLGIIFGNLDQHENAVRAFSELSDLASESGNYALALNAEKNLVKHAIAEGKIEEIINHSRRGLELIDFHLNDADEREAFEEMLMLGLMSKGDYKTAEEELEIILERAEETADKPKLLTSLGQLADAHYALGKLEAARDEYQRALDLSVRLQEKVIEARILSRLAALSADQDDLE
jgi:tetratricopeptide (TPR) repeat protein